MPMWIPHNEQHCRVVPTWPNLPQPRAVTLQIHTKQCLKNVRGEVFQTIMILRTGNRNGKIKSGLIIMQRTVGNGFPTYQRFHDFMTENVGKESLMTITQTTSHSITSE